MLKRLRNNLGVIMFVILLSLIALGATYVNIGPTTLFEGDVGIPSDAGYFFDGAIKIRNNSGTFEARNFADDAYVDFKALLLYGDGSNITNIGESAATGLTINVKEENTSSIVKGQPVYVSGATGGAFPEVGLADSDDAAKYEVIGLAAEDISQNAQGLVRVSGLLTGVDTLGTTPVNPDNETWVASDLLFLNTIAGGLTNVEPTTGRVVEVGYSLYGSSNTDAILLMIHAPHIHIEVSAGEDIVLRLGDSAGSNKIIIKGYDNVEVASIDSDGKADFNELLLDTVLALAEGGTGVNSGAMTLLTSILNAGLYVGRDADNQIKFTTDNKIVYRINGADRMEMLSTGELDMKSGSVVFTEQTLTSGTAIAWNLANSNKAALTAAHDFTITIAAPSGVLNAQIIITQDGTGTRIMDEIVTQKDEAISTAEVHTDTEIIDLTIDIPTGARIRFQTSAADLPDPLVVDTIYWAIRSSENYIKVSTTKANAIAGTAINLIDTGTGTHTVHQLVKWMDGALGVLTTDAGAEDIVSLTYKTADEQWYAQIGLNFQ